jgi:hypothetical protein
VWSISAVTAACIAATGAATLPPPLPNTAVDQFVLWAADQGTPVRNPACSTADSTVTCYGTAAGAIVGAEAELGEDGSLGSFTAIGATSTSNPEQSVPVAGETSTSSNALARIDGSGSDVVELPTTINELVVLDLIYETDEIPPIEITGLDANLTKTDASVVVFEGTSHSRYVFDAAGTQVKHLQIVAQEDWTIELLPVSALDTWIGDSPLEGVDSTVVVYTGAAGLLDYSFEERPETWYGSQFCVVARSPDGSDSQLVVDMTLQSTQGTTTIPAGPALIEVDAIGSWVLAAVQSPS